MFNRYLTYYKSSVQTLSLIGLIAVCILFLGIMQWLILPILAPDLSAVEFSMNFSNPSLIQAHRIMQFVSQIMVFLLPALLFAYLAFPKPTQYLKLKTQLQTKHLVYGVLIMGLSIPFIDLLQYVSTLIPWGEKILALEDGNKEIVEAFLTTNNWGVLIFNIFIFVVMAALCEELLFRGVLQNILISTSFKKKPFIAILITAIIFSLIHTSATGFLPRLYAGLLLGFVYYFCNNIWIPIAMHALNNGFALAVFYLTETDMENPIVSLDWKDWLEIIPLTLISLFLIYKFYQSRVEYRIDSVPIDPDETHFLANR